MAQNESVRFFVDALNSRMAAVKTALRDAVQSLLNPSSQHRKGNLQVLQRDLEILRDFLAPGQHPTWLQQTIAAVKRAVANADSNDEQSFYTLASELCPTIMPHEWNFEATADNAGVDFDPIYDHHRKECRIPELFDSLIGRL